MVRKRIDVAFEDCLAAYRAGATIEECLSRYPEVAAELRPLLETALALVSAQLPPPALAYQLRAKERFEFAMRQKRRLHAGNPAASPFRWLFPASAAAVLALAAVAFASATLLTDSDQPLTGGSTFTPTQVTRLAIERSVFERADQAIARIGIAIRSGQPIDPTAIEDLKNANEKIAKAVENGGLDESTKQAVQTIAGKQLVVLAQIQHTEAESGIPAPDDSQTAKATITAIIDVVDKTLGLPPVTPTVIKETPTVTPTEEPSPLPTPTPEPTQAPAPTPAPTQTPLSQTSPSAPETTSTSTPAP